MIHHGTAALLSAVPKTTPHVHHGKHYPDARGEEEHGETLRDESSAQSGAATKLLSKLVKAGQRKGLFGTFALNRA